jgi:hypothetical protein
MMNLNPVEMLDLIEYLEPTPKKRGKYICPVCGGDNLSIAKSGKFACYSSDCGPKEIYKATKQIAGLWVDNTDFDRDGYQALIQHRAEETHRKRLAQQAQSPGYDRRHREISAELSRSPLTESHRQTLHGRGFDDAAIEHFGFWSTDQDKHGAGIAGAVRGLDGRYIGIAYRWDESDHARYTFASRYSHIPQSDDLIIATHEPIGNVDGSVLFLSEGLIIKPQIAAMRLGGRVIGYGGGSGNIADRCKAQLLAAIEQFQPREIRILPDAGWAVNRGVRVALQSLVSLLSPVVPVMLGDWGQANDSEKAIGDIDDVSPDRLASIQWRPGAELLPDRPKQKSSSLYQRWKAQAILTGEALPGRYFGESLDRFPKRGLTFMSGSTGSGKTTAMESIAKDYDQVIYFTSQESTAQQATLEILGEGFYRKEKQRLRRGDSFGSCIAALDERNGTDWANVIDPSLRSLVIFDEVETITSWVDNQTGEIKSKFEAIVSGANHLLCASATVRQADLKLLEDIRGEKATVLTLHQAPIAKTVAIETIEKKNPTEANFNQRIKEVIDRALDGEPQGLFSGGQALSSKTGTAAIEAIAISRGIPPKKIVRLDSETMRNPDRPEFGFSRWGAEKQEALLDSALLAIGSPSLRNGFSVLIERFKTVTVIDAGHLNPQDGIQYADRFRRVTDLRICITESDRQSLYGGETDPAKIKRILMQNGRSFHGMKSTQTDSPWLDFHCRSAALHNLGFISKATILAEYFSELGHTVTKRVARCGLKGKDLQEWNESLKACGELYKSSLMDGADLSPRGLEAIEEQDTQSTADYWALRKGSLRRKLDLWGEGHDEDGNRAFNVPLPFLPELIAQVEHGQIHKPWKRSFTALCLSDEDRDYLAYQNRKYTHRLTRKGLRHNPAIRSIAGQFAVIQKLGVLDFVRQFAVTDVDDKTYRDLSVCEQDTDSTALRDDLGRRIVSAIDPAQHFSIRGERISQIAAQLRTFGLDRVNYALGTSIQPNDPPKPKPAESDDAYERRRTRWIKSQPAQRCGETEQSASYRTKIAKWESEGAQPRRKPRLAKPETDDAYRLRRQAWLDREPVQRPAETMEQYRKRWERMKADGSWAEVDGRQVITLLRQYFKARTFADRGRHTDQGKGVHVLSLDDVLNTFKVKLETTARRNKSAQDSGEPLSSFAFSDMPAMHRRSEFFGLWKQQHDHRIDQANSGDGSLFPNKTPDLQANNDPGIELATVPRFISHTAGWSATAFDPPCNWVITRIDGSIATIQPVHRPEIESTVQLASVPAECLVFA